MANSSGPLAESWHGFVPNTWDALVLFEACLAGDLNHIPRRPHDREREDLIKSGNVFVYEEHSSGIKRWTDGYNWSPSRILGNFLVYRELDRDFPAGEKKKANKRKKTAGISKTEQQGCRPGPSSEMAVAAAASERPSPERPSPEDNADAELERALVGSLVDSYPFKQGGLVKKTISVQWNGIPHHLVSYYTLQDVKSGSLKTPCGTELHDTLPRESLVCQQNFRVPINHEDAAISALANRYPAMFSRQTPAGQGQGVEYGDDSAAVTRSASFPNMPTAMGGYPGPHTHLSLGMPQSMAPNFSGLPAMAFPGNGYLEQPGHHSTFDPRGAASSWAPDPRDTDLGMPFPGAATPNSYPFAMDPSVSTGGELPGSSLMASAPALAHPMMMNGIGTGAEAVMSPHDLATHEHRASIMSVSADSDTFSSPMEAASHAAHAAIMANGDAVFQHGYFEHASSIGQSSQPEQAAQGDAMEPPSDGSADLAMGQLDHGASMPRLDETWFPDEQPQHLPSSFQHPGTSERRWPSSGQP